MTSLRSCFEDVMMITVCWIFLWWFRTGCVCDVAPLWASFVFVSLLVVL